MNKIKNLIWHFFNRFKFICKESVIRFTRSIVPYKSVNYYQQYFATCTRVSVQKDQNELLLFKVYFTLMTYFVFLTGAFYLFPLSPKARLVLVDMVFILKNQQSNNLFFAIYTCYAISIQWTMYAREKNLLFNNIFENILFGSKGKNCNRIIKNSNLNKFVYFDATFTKEKYLKTVLIITNAMQIFPLLLNACWAVFVVTFTVRLCGSSDHLFQSAVHFAVLGPILLFHLAISFICCYSLGNTLAFMATYAIIIILYVINTFKRNYAGLVKRIKVTSERHLRAALTSNLHLFELLFIADAFWGQVFFAYLLFHMPISAYYSVQIANSKVNGLMLYVLLISICESFTGSLCIHLGKSVFVDHIKILF